MSFQLFPALQASHDLISAGDQLKTATSNREELERQFQAATAVLELVDVTHDNYLTRVMAKWKLAPLVYEAFPGMFGIMAQFKPTKVRSVMSQMSVYLWLVKSASASTESELDEMIAKSRALIQEVLA